VTHHVSQLSHLELSHLEIEGEVFESGLRTLTGGCGSGSDPRTRSMAIKGYRTVDVHLDMRQASVPGTCRRRNLNDMHRFIPWVMKALGMLRVSCEG
jgi:hypothetical protein